jgi:hypothetical protein
MMKQTLNGINARIFFTQYCNGVKNYTHKMRGIDGHGNPIAFSDKDKLLIREAMMKMITDINSKLKN